MNGHEHEAWQLRDSANGGTYCAACGAEVTGLRIFEKHPDTDAYRFGPSFTPYAIVAVEKRFTDAELAAEFHAFVMTDHKYPADPDEYGDEEWEAYSREYTAAERTLLRFATLPHFDEVTP